MAHVTGKDRQMCVTAYELERSRVREAGMEILMEVIGLQAMRGCTGRRCRGCSSWGAFQCP